MAKPYSLSPYQEEQSFPRSLSEKIAGFDERKRSTKTYIPNNALAIRLGVVENHAEKMLQRLISLHQKQTGVLLTPEEAMERFPSVRTFDGFHQQCVEHMASLKGYALKVVARAEMLRSQQQMQESSINVSEQRE